jgi:hypothetical protein
LISCGENLEGEFCGSQWAFEDIMEILEEKFWECSDEFYLEKALIERYLNQEVACL